jgi:hypothetical protein
MKRRGLASSKIDELGTQLAILGIQIDDIDGEETKPEHVPAFERIKEGDPHSLIRASITSDISGNILVSWM